MNAPLHPQALDLLAAAGVTVEPHRSDPGQWIYTLPSGQQGGAETPQRAAALALDHMRAGLLDLQALADTLTAEIAELHQEFARVRAEAGAVAAELARLADEQGRGA